MLSTSGSYGQLAGWLADEIRVKVEIFKILYRSNFVTFNISYYSIRNAFQSAFLNYTVQRVIFEAEIFAGEVEFKFNSKVENFEDYEIMHLLCVCKFQRVENGTISSSYSAWLSRYLAS